MPKYDDNYGFLYGNYNVIVMRQICAQRNNIQIVQKPHMYAPCINVKKKQKANPPLQKCAL